MTRIFTLLTGALLSVTISLAQTPDYNIIQLSHPQVRDQVYGFTEAADGSVYFFNADDEVFVSRNDAIQPVGFDCPSFCRIQNISLDTAGNLYVATSMDGLFRYGAAGQENLLDDHVTSVAVAPDGTIYAGTDKNGIAVWLDGDWFYLTKEADGLPTNKIFQLVLEASGKLWVASDEGLFSLDNAQVSAAPIPSQLSRSFYQMVLGTDGAVWVNSAFGGIGAYKDGSWTVFPSIFSPGKSTTRIAVSSTGVAWTSDKDGLVRVANGAATTLPYDSLGLGSGFIVRGLFMDSRDRLWVSLDFSNDLAIVTEEVVSGLFGQAQQLASLRAFPNPAQERVRISWSDLITGPVPEYLSVYNATGQKLRQYALEQGHGYFDLDVSQLGSGLYRFNLWGGNQLLAGGKLVVE